jgi:putative FmdB family regulatory protein
VACLKLVKFLTVCKYLSIKQLLNIGYNAHLACLLYILVTMPIYDYQCSSCNHKQEVLRKSSAPNVEVCPQCGKETFAKQVSAPNFQLLGTGWYATDFKDKKSASPAKAGAATETKTTDTEAKPAAACSPGCACH